MKNLFKVIGIIALVAVVGTANVACQGGGGGSASAAAKAIGATGKTYTLSKESDFKYDLTKIDGQDYIVIQGINPPEGFVASRKDEDNKTIIVDTLSINIPEKIEGYTVGAIGVVGDPLGGGIGGFLNSIDSRNIVAVSIPDTIIEIGDNAISNTSISSLKLPKNLKKLGSHAFAVNTNLSGTLTIPEGVEIIPYSAFQGTKITELVLPDSVTTIATFAFEGSSELTTVKLPSGPIQYLHDNGDGKLFASSWASSIGANGAFWQCPKLSLATRSAIEASGYTGEF